MNKQHRIRLFICGLVIIMAVALWSGFAAPRAFANVTLVSFTGTSLPGQPEIFIEWETATEFNTVGFFITRGNSVTGPFTRVSDFVPHEGDTIVGAQYDWIDEDTALNQAYWYKLEEVTSNQQPEYYGPITVTAGIPATVTPPASDTPTATATRTPTATPSPTATSATQPNTTTNTNSTTSSSNTVAATPRVVTGATVTPRPTSLGVSSRPAVTTTPLANVPNSQQQPQAVATSAPVAVDSAVATVAPLSPAAVDVAQAPDPTLVPAAAAPAIAAPAIVVTESAPVTSANDSTNGSALLLVAAAILFLSIAFFILRQARQ